MRKILSVALIAILFASCSTTRDYISDYTLSETVPLEEKLDYYGGKKVSVDLPEMFFTGEEWLERMTELASSAEDYILISTFLGSSSELTEPFYKILMDKAYSGVDVYFIMDGTSSYDMTESQYYMTPLYFLREAGVHLLEYNPMSAMHIAKPSSLIQRDHRKLFVVDGKWAAIGGMNINYISLGAGKGRTQRDSMYLFSSPSLSSALIEEFAAIWNASSVEKIDEDRFNRDESDNGSYSAYLFNYGTGSNDSISGLYGSLFASAEEEMIILPYLPILDKKMEKAVSLASERGVDIKIYMDIDSRGYAMNGMSYYLSSLIRNTGAEIYLVHTDENGTELPLMHEKLMIIDSRYVLIGSTNFNFRSMGLSYEISLLIDSPELAEKLKEHVKERTSSAVLLTAEDADRMKKEYGSLFSYLFMYYGG